MARSKLKKNDSQKRLSLIVFDAHLPKTRLKRRPVTNQKRGDTEKPEE